MSSENQVATLVRGNIYVIRNPTGGADIEFHKNISVVVGNDLAEYLATIVDEICGSPDPDSGDFDIIEKSKFEFADYNGDAPVGTVVRLKPEPETAPTRRRIQKKAA